MKITFLLSLFILSFNVIAQIGDEDCEKSPLSNELESLATSLQIPNCKTRKNISAANKADYTRLCEDCKPKFEAALKRNPVVTSGVKPIDLKEIVNNELKRSLSANLLNIVKLRTIYPTNANFSPAIKACSMNNFEKRIKNKKCGKTISLSELKNQLAEEVGHLLSPSPRNDDKGILNRTSSKNSCNISDESILRAKALALENTLDDDLISSLSAIKKTDQYSIEAAIASIGHKKNNKHLLAAFSSHPVFSQFLDPPEKLVSFFKNLPKPISVKQLQASLYMDKAANDSLTANIAKRCEEAFKSYEDVACNDNLASGNVKIGGLKESVVLIDIPRAKVGEYVDLDQEDEIKSNMELLNLCNLQSKRKDALNFTQEIEKISSWMPKEDASIKYENYRTNKYENEIGTIRTILCDIQSGKQKCENKDYTCQVYDILKNEKKPNTTESRLAKSSDKNVNALIGSLIGSPTDISPATRTTLINEGILPKNSKGEFVEQPDVPERRPEFKAQMAEMAKAAAPATQAIPAAAAIPSKQTKGAPAKTAASSTASSSSKAAPSATKDALPLDSSEPDMSSFNDEILRRLSEGKGGSKKPVTKQEAKEAVRKTAKKKGKKLTPAQENYYADKVMSSYTADPKFPADTDVEKATLTPGDTLKEQREKEQKLKALAGMQGAQAAGGRSPASDTDADAEKRKSEPQSKKLSTVALNIPEDKIKLNLSDVLNDKIVSNESEGQLLKVFIQNKKDFILQVNGLSFKVKYDKANKGFTVLFNSGDSKEAARLKPQLEKFFRHMNSSVAH